jgi:hypothetical protein
MKLLRVLLASVGTAGAAFVSIAQASVDVGQSAPDFSLTGIDGQTHRLSDYKGKIVVLEWNNPDCPFVHKHYDSGNIPRLQHRAEAQGVVWLVINSGAPEQQGADYTSAQIGDWLKERDSAPTEYLRDPSGKVGKLYGAKATPHLFVIRANGRLAYEGAIDSIRSSDQADIPRADNYVADALAAVEAGKPVAKTYSQAYGCPVKY